MSNDQLSRMEKKLQCKSLKTCMLTKFSPVPCWIRSLRAKWGPQRPDALQKQGTRHEAAYLSTGRKSKTLDSPLGSWWPSYRQNTEDIVSGEIVGSRFRLMHIRHRAEQRWCMGLKIIMPQHVTVRCTDKNMILKIPRWGSGEREEDHIQTYTNKHNCIQSSTRNSRSWKITGESLQSSGEIFNLEPMT